MWTKRLKKPKSYFKNVWAWRGPPSLINLVTFLLWFGTIIWQEDGSLIILAGVSQPVDCCYCYFFKKSLHFGFCFTVVLRTINVKNIKLYGYYQSIKSLLFSEADQKTWGGCGPEGHHLYWLIVLYVIDQGCLWLLCQTIREM